MGHFVFALSFALLCVASFSRSPLQHLTGLDVVPGGLAASVYSWNEEDFFDLSTDVSIHYVQNTPSYFWSHQFGVRGSGGQNGYIGLQGEGSLFNDTFLGRAAVFSIWNSVAGTPLANDAVCGEFGGEGTGFSCRRKFAWVDAHRYRLKVFRMASPSNASGAEIWWGAGVEDLSTYQLHLIGQIQTPSNWTGTLHGPTIFFAEYYASLNGCADLPFTRIQIFTPVASGALATNSTAAPYGRCKTDAAAACSKSLQYCSLVTGIVKKK